jgi:uncharacterized protein YjbI with pentapeptide repeats
MSNKRFGVAVSQHLKQWLTTVAFSQPIWQQRALMLAIVCWSALVISLGLVSPLPVLADDYNHDFRVGADFAGKDLTDSSFTKANLRGSNFSHSDLHGVSFFGANLEDTNFEGADCETPR